MYNRFGSCDHQGQREQSAKLDRADHGTGSQGSLELLVRGPEQDFVRVHLLRLAHGEGDCPFLTYAYSAV